MALTFQDGVVELRRADGSLRQAVSLGGCGRYGFWFGGDVLSLEGPERTARIRVGRMRSSSAKSRLAASRQVIAAGRNRHAESAALAKRALYIHRAAVPRREFGHQRQTDA